MEVLNPTLFWLSINYYITCISFASWVFWYNIFYVGCEQIIYWGIDYKANIKIKEKAIC